MLESEVISHPAFDAQAYRDAWMLRLFSDPEFKAALIELCEQACRDEGLASPLDPVRFQALIEGPRLRPQIHALIVAISRELGYSI